MGIDAQRKEQDMRRAISSAILTAFASTGVAAPDFTDTAQVVSATPIIERVTEPRQECGPAAAGAPAQERSLVGPVVGGVAGAIIGHQVGRGSGRTAATATGAAVGTIVGDRVANPGGGERPVTGAAVGAAAGGLLGAQVGRGSGRDAAAAAGAITGAIVGDRVQNPQAASATAQAAHNCRTVETIREVVKGYTVVYRYNGRDITTTLPYNPGSTVRVGVSVIDGAPPSAPSAGMTGSNAREAGRPAPVPDAAPVSAGGGYPYRY
jgi:uncharacterized protein YcfJ